MITYIVRGGWDDSLGEFNYWNEDRGWDSIENATHYDLIVFQRPLPVGASGVVEFRNNELFTSYTVVPVEPPPPWESPFVWN